MFYWLAKFVLLGPLLRGLWRPWAEGLENIPDDRPAIIASNHLSFCDSFFMPVMVPRKVTFLAKAEYFTTPGIKGFFSRMFFAGVGQVPIDRSDADASKAALNTGVRVLAEGKLLGIYPEGTRSPDGRLYRGKTGVARLALGCDVPVIPVGLVGTRLVQSPGSMVMRPFHTVTVRFGPPVAYDVAGRQVTTGECTPGRPAGEGARGDAEQEELRALTDALMAGIAGLSGQEYVDQYASRKKVAPGDGDPAIAPA